MLIYLLPLIIIFSFTFTQLKHPLSAGIMLLMQTTLMALYTGYVSFTFWISYIMFLIFLGAMLVLFIYVASLASNEKFKFNMNMIFLFSIFLIFITILMSFSMWLIMSSYMKIQLPTITNLILENFNQITTSSLYEIPSSQFTLFIISYLLLTLFIIVKIMNIKKIPLRSFY